MCIIIDANFANLLVHSNEDIRKDMRPIMNWIRHTMVELLLVVN